jgi:glycerol-3-phosphate dehydrogenase
LVSVAGGKYTTYRVMARDAVDAAADDLGRPAPPSVTENVPLLGADGYLAMINRLEPLAEELGVAAWRLRRLLGRYGSMVAEVLAPIAKEPELAAPVKGADEYLAAELRYAASHEGALHLDDLLTRRTRISIETTDRGTESARAAAEIVAPVLGWAPDTVDREVETYLARVEAERASQQEMEDAAADAARLLAPELRRTRDTHLS